MQGLDAAMGRFKAAVEATPEDHPDQADVLNSLGAYLKMRYGRTGSLQDLEAAIATLEAVLEATPRDHPSRASILNNLGASLRSRYQRTGNLQDLEASIAMLEVAVEETPADHPDRAGRLSNLGNHYSSRYERTGHVQDLEAAISTLEAALEVIPWDHPFRAAILNNLGNRLCSRSCRTGNLQDLEAAIARSEAAVEATPEDHPDRAGRLGNLGNHLMNRYQRTGSMQDLEAAIAWSEAAVEAIPRDHPDRATMLHILGDNLSKRYERTGNLQDLEAAIARLGAAVEATPEDHPDRAQSLGNLGHRFGCRYERTGNLQDLEAAIARSEAAVEATPEDHPRRAGRLSNLGIQFRSRYQRIGNPQDLEAAIAWSEAAVEAIPWDHPNRAPILNTLGTNLSSRYKLTGNRQDLEAAIARSEEAVEETPEDHPDRAGQLNCLGNHYVSRYERTGNVQDVGAAITTYLSSWSIISAQILTRIVSAYKAATLLVFIVKDVARASLLLRNAINILPLATLRSLQREDQQHILGQLIGLASFATSVSLEAGEPPLEALRLLELGRSVTNNQLLDYRSNISDLLEHHPALAGQFDSLRQELDLPFPSLESSDMSKEERLQVQQSTIGRRNKVAKDLDHILLQIREKPGFEDFLLADSEAHLLAAAQEGPIVVLNVTILRSDAILLTTAGVTSIPLPELTHASMEKYCGESASNLGNEVQRELLEWLWQAAVQPVLRQLGFYANPTSKMSDPLARIWWIGVGLMAKAPIHAAAKFKKGRVALTTLQYCIPSYTSTIRALQYSRARQSQCRKNTSMLIVTMPTTPGQSSLSGVVAEADGITFSLRDFRTVVTLERPTAESVLQVLPEYGIAHFACHGISQVNPADSHLLLRKELVLAPKGLTERVDELCVKDIAALKLPIARLAYLSACSTAQVSASSTVIDEVTHIVSSFHIAGFVHVIGTLWPSQDVACQKMAVDFYSALSKTDDVAVSYRTAIMGLMREKPAQPMYWAPFIQFGA